MPSVGHRWRIAAVAIAVAAGLVGLAGCGGADRSSSPNAATGGGAAPADQARAEQAKADEAKKAAAPEAGPGGALAAPAKYLKDDRSIVYTGEISVRVKKVDEAARQAVEIAENAGGFVGGDKRTSGEKSSEAHLTLRVPAGKFTSTVDSLSKLGTEEARGISADDVTQEVVDLDAQIASQKASVDRTRALLARAQTIGEIVSIEGELAKRESALATLEARKRKLAELTSLSTITAHLLGPDAASPQKPEENATFLSGLRTGWDAFLGAAGVLLVMLGFLLPFTVLLGVPLFVLVWLIRRRRPVPGAAPGAPVPAPAPGPITGSPGP